MTNDNRGDKQKTVRMNDEMISEIEKQALEDDRSFSDQCRYLIKLGMKERDRIDAYISRGPDHVAGSSLPEPKEGII